MNDHSEPDLAELPRLQAHQASQLDNERLAGYLLLLHDTASVELQPLIVEAARRLLRTCRR